MKLSVIIPAYNASGTITRCLNSVKNQTSNADIQIIVVNDGSTDLTSEIVLRYIEKNPSLNIELINKTNGGVSSTRNAGLRRATGEYVALLDSDDAWLETKIEKQINVLNSNLEIDYLGCNTIGSKVAVLGREITQLTPIDYKKLFIKWYPQTSTVIFKHEIIDKIGYYDETMTHGEDGQYLLRICSKFSCWFMPEQLVEFGVNNKRGYGESGLSSNLKAMHKGQLTILKYALNNQLITKLRYCCLCLYEKLKYLRRIIITKWSR